MLASSFWASRTNSARRVTVVTSFHGMVGLLSRPTLPKRKSVTHVSERAPPMSPVYTIVRGQTALEIGWVNHSQSLPVEEPPGEVIQRLVVVHGPVLNLLEDGELLDRQVLSDARFRSTPE